MKVSIFVHNLSSNPIVRVYPIAKAIQLLGHDVEILGLTYYDSNVYKPYRNDFEYKTIQSYDDIRWVIINGYKLSKLATGDIVYVFKPLWGTFWPGLLYSFWGFRRKLILDSEDNELWDAFIGNGWNDILKHPYYPINPIYNKLLHPFTLFSTYKTVVCSRLQQRYGGDIVLHGPDATQFDPDKFIIQTLLRKKYGLPLDARLLLFAGRPVFYNGLPFIVQALQKTSTTSWHLVLAGNPEEPLFLEAKKQLGDRCHILGFIPYENMAELVKLVDVVPIIQSRIPTTEMQMPAKLFEAMSMAKGIIATNVCDIPNLLENKRGWVIEPEDTNGFLEILILIDKEPSLLGSFGNASRNYFCQNASVEVIAEKIKPYFE